MKKSAVIKYFGTGAHVARSLQITRQAVSNWPDIVPEVYALRLEKITEGRLVYDESLYRRA